jgi:hypothetical protein
MLNKISARDVKADTDTYIIYLPSESEHFAAFVSYEGMTFNLDEAMQFRTSDAIKFRKHYEANNNGKQAYLIDKDYITGRSINAVQTGWVDEAAKKMPYNSWE